MTRLIPDRLRAFAADQAGNATLEFAVLVPWLLYIIFSMGEAGTLMVRSVMLDRGLDIAVRDIRLGLPTRDSVDAIKARVCEGAFLLTNCEDSLLIELRPLNDLTAFSGQANCVDRTETLTPTVTYTPGSNSEIMFIRACIIVDPIFPGMGLGAMLPRDASGGYAIVAQSAFMNEPA